MKVIDKLRCPSDYNCHKCKNYSRAASSTYYSCELEHRTSFFSIEKIKGWKNVVKRITYKDRLMCFELVCGDYERD